MPRALPARIILRAVIAAMLLAACGGHGGSASTSSSQFASTTEAPAPTTTTEPPHPFLADIAASMGVDVTEAEGFLAGIAEEEGVDVEFLLGLGDFEDLLSPISPTLEQVRRSLPGEFLEGLCPLEAPLPGVSAFGTDPGLYKVIVATDFDGGLGDWADDRAEEPERFAERWLGIAESAIQDTVAVGDASLEVAYDRRRVSFPGDWLADSYEEISLVACVTSVQTDEIIRTCTYDVAGRARDVTFETRRSATRIEIYDAATANPVLDLLMPGQEAEDPDCPISLSLPEDMVEEAKDGPVVRYGRQPTTDDVLMAIERVVAPPELTPAATANVGEHNYEVEVHEEGCNLGGGGEAIRRVSFGTGNVAIENPEKQNPPTVFESSGEDSYRTSAGIGDPQRLQVTFSPDGYLLEIQRQGKLVVGEPIPWEPCGHWVFTLAD